MKKKPSVKILPALATAFVCTVPSPGGAKLEQPHVDFDNTKNNKNLETLEQKQDELYNRIKWELLSDIRDAFFNILSGIIEFIRKSIEYLRSQKNSVEQYEQSFSSEICNEYQLYLMSTNKVVFKNIRRTIQDEDDCILDNEEEKEIYRTILEGEYLMLYTCYKDLKL